MAEYFKNEEFTCKCCGQLPEGGMNTTLIEKLDELRERIGYPIVVTCGYRCENHNAETAGSAKKSQHCLGNAADIYCDELSVDALADTAVQVGFDGIGRYYGQEFVHVDMRDNGTNPNYYTWTDRD